MQSTDKYISLYIFPGKIHILEKMRVCGQVGEYRKCGEYPELGMAQIARILYFLHQYREDLLTAKPCVPKIMIVESWSNVLMPRKVYGNF